MRLRREFEKGLLSTVIIIYDFSAETSSGRRRKKRSEGARPLSGLSIELIAIMVHKVLKVD